jgi:hypothetical protein
MLPALAAILAVIAAGILHVSAWAAVAGACILGLVSLTSSQGAFSRYGYAGSPIGLPVVLVSTLLNASAAAAAAFVLGRLIAWVWGI